MPVNAKKMVIEIDPATGVSTVNGADAIPLGNLVLMETVGGANVKHKVLSISERAVITTNPGCYWTVIGGVLYKICPP